MSWNPTQNNSYRAKLFIVEVDAAKDTVVSRMRLKMPGAGYMHLPDWAEDEYIAQLTSEKAIRKYVLGRGAVREWIKTRERTEASDLEVYVLAALRTRGANYLRKALQAPVAAEKSITGYLVLFPQADPEPFAAVTLTTPHLFEMERGCLHCDHERPQRAPKPRKSSITGSVRYEFVCKHPNKPANPFPRGDIDNYVKAVQDALTAAGAWDDDVQVVEISEIKRYARPDESPHILIEVEPISIS